MAPALVETPTQQGAGPAAELEWQKKELNKGRSHKEAFAQSASTTNYEGELKGIDGHAPAKYPHYLPVWEPTTYPPLQIFEHYEHGKDADLSFPNLLKDDAKVIDITANIGAEVTGVQLSKLNKAGKDELAAFVAQKKVVGKSHKVLQRRTKLMEGSLSQSGLCRLAHPRSPRLCRVLRTQPHPPSVRRTQRVPSSSSCTPLCRRYDSQGLLRNPYKQHDMAQRCHL